MSKNKVKDFLYEKETYLIRGACFKIWKEFGGAFKEKVVDRALEEELKTLGLKVESQKSIDIYYRDKKIASYVPDKIINDAILIEVKCKPFLTKEDERQFWLYLKGSKYKLGLLINFGSRKLEIKRRIYDKAREKRFQRKSALLSAFIGFYVAITLLFFGFSVSAQQNISPRLSVSPHTFELDVFLGETRIEKIKITNKSEVALPILVRTVDFTAADETGGMKFDTTVQEPSIASRKWIKIENPNFILDSGETERINFTISVPENAEPGGHYSVMLFEPQLPSFYFKEDQPRAIPVIGVLFLFSVKVLMLGPEVEQKLEVVEFSVPKEERLVALENLTSAFIGRVVQAASEITITKKSPSSFLLRIKNNDIYHIKPFGKVLIFNIFGKEVGQAKIPQRTILPGKIRQFPIEFSAETPSYLKWLPASISNFLAKNFFFGKYQARLMLETSDKRQEIGRNNLVAGRWLLVSSMTFFSFPWQFWLGAIFILGLVIFLSIKYRKRITLSLKVLVGR